MKRDTKRNLIQPPRPFRKVPAEELATLPIHPFADMFPMLADDQLMRLAQSLSGNQEHPVIVCRRVVVDGRNRIAAGRRLNLKLLVDERDSLTEDEIRKLITELNLERRSLPKTKLVEMAATLYQQFEDSGTPQSLDQVAQLFGVSRRSLCRFRAQQKLPAQRPKPRAALRRLPEKFRTIAIAISNVDLLKGRPQVYERYCGELYDLTNELLSEPELQHLQHDELDGAGTTFDPIRTSDQIEPGPHGDNSNGG